MANWEIIYRKLKEKIKKILDEREVFLADLKFEEIFGIVLKEILLEEKIIKQKEVGRDTYRNIPGKQVLFTDKSKRKISVREASIK
jgi:phosphoribosylaminoimidazole-succinocarboxamide synthase